MPARLGFPPSCPRRGVPRALIAETIDIVAVLSGRGAERRLSELAHVQGLGPGGLGPGGDYLLTPLEGPLS